MQAAVHVGASSEEMVSLARGGRGKRRREPATRMPGWPMKRIHNYIFETQVHVIPIALGTDERMTKRLQEVVAIQERRIKNHEWIDNDGKKSQRPLVKY